MEIKQYKQNIKTMKDTKYGIICREVFIISNKEKTLLNYQKSRLLFSLNIIRFQ